MKRFNTIFRLTVGYQGNIYFQFENSNINKNIDFDAEIIKDGFNIGNSRSSIFIYNLSKDKRNGLERLVSISDNANFQFLLECALMNQVNQYQLLAYDDIIGIYNQEGETDYKTNLILKSGEDMRLKNYVSVSYSSDTQLSDILKKECARLVDSNSIKSFSVSSNINNKTYAYGYSYSGNVMDNINKLCYETGNIAFVEDGRLKIYPAAQMPQSTGNTTDLNTYNGLLEPPHLGQTSYRKKYQAEYSVKAFIFKSLLLPTVSINDVISVNTKPFTVKRMTHTIKTRSPSMAYSEVEGFYNQNGTTT